MSTCWYCHWGWALPVADIYEKAVEKLDGDESVLHFGPSHIVWEDENFDSAQWCIDNFDAYKRDYSDKELEVCKWSLQELVKLEPDVRDPCPAEFEDDDEHPEKYLPKSPVRKVSK